MGPCIYNKGMDIHHFTDRGCAVYLWEEVPEELRVTPAMIIGGWTPEYRGLPRQRRFLAALTEATCRAAVLPDPWWTRPIPWAPCRKRGHEGWCERHRPAPPKTFRRPSLFVRDC